MQYKDATGYAFELTQTPRRIVSLVPSQTEYISDLGLAETLVGITRFCIHPDHVFSKTSKVGGTKQPDIEKIKSLSPDFIVANKEENEKEVVMKLRTFCPVWVSDVRNLPQALGMMEDLGRIFQKEHVAISLTQRISEGFNALAPLKNPLRVLYFIWRKPYMSVSGDTFIGDMLERLGFVNVMAESSSRYPVLQPEEIQALRPDVICLSSEPYPFREQHIEELKALCPQAQITLVDGEMFSWYGSRLMQSIPYFQKWIQPWQ